MSRTAKQFVYGTIYILILALISVWVYFAFVRPEASCTNGRRDRGEGGVDCGGVCPRVCLPADLRPVEIVGEPQIFRPSGSLASILTRVQNPNLELSAKSFDYALTLYDASGSIVARDYQDQFVYAGEIKYLVSFVRLPDSSRVSRAEVAVQNAVWTDAAKYSRPEIDVQERQTNVLGDKLVASGKILNQDTVDFPEVAVLAVFRDRYGLLAGVSRTEIQNVKIGEPRAFDAIHPPLVSVDPSKTEYFVYAARP